MTFSSFGEHGEVDERILLDAACGGDERAFGVLLERHRPGLETVCRMMLGDPRHADRAMQEAVLSAWRQRGLAPASSSVQMWLYRIAVRACTETFEVTGDEFHCRGTFDEVNGDDDPDVL